MKKQESNCGSPDWPEIVRKALSDSFEDACEVHDIDYFEQTKTKEQADKDFLLNMINSSKGFFGHMRAMIYYYSVKKFGMKNWIKGKK